MKKFAILYLILLSIMGCEKDYLVMEVDNPLPTLEYPIQYWDMYAEKTWSDTITRVQEIYEVEVHIYDDCGGQFILDTMYYSFNNNIIFIEAPKECRNKGYSSDQVRGMIYITNYNLSKNK